MSLRDELLDDDASVRLYAAKRAAEAGGDELFDVLLDMALHDPAEVQTTGGMAEVWQHVSDAAAGAVKAILSRREEPDPRIRAAVTDLANDDQRVAKLLYHLGDRYEPVRRELESSEEERLRLRALRAVLSIHRAPELTGRFLRDPAPAVRVEALKGAAPSPAELERLLTDPVVEVRKAAVKALRHATRSAAYVAAARVETDPGIRRDVIDGLRCRPRDRAVQLAIAGYLADAHTQRSAAEALANSDDPGVAAAVASRILAGTDEWALEKLLGHTHLLTYAPELREMLEHLHRHTPSVLTHRRLTAVLEAPATPYPPGDPADGLDAPRRARLHREVLRWALAALGPAAIGGAEARALAGLRAWLDAAGDQAPTAADGARGAGVAGECLRAAASGDLRDALHAGVRAAVQAARRDPAAGGDATVVDPHRAADVARLAQLFTARQIRAGVDPLPPAPPRPLLLNGPDALTVGMTHLRHAPAALALRRPRPLAGGRPADAALLGRCRQCGAALRVHGTLEWVYRDDDRTREWDDGFAGTLDGTCAACGTGRKIGVRVTLTVSRGDGSAELSWDALEDVRAPTG